MGEITIDEGDRQTRKRADEGIVIGNFSLVLIRWSIYFGSTYLTRHRILFLLFLRESMMDRHQMRDRQGIEDGKHHMVLYL